MPLPPLPAGYSQPGSSDVANSGGLPPLPKGYQALPDQDKLPPLPSGYQAKPDQTKTNPGFVMPPDLLPNYKPLVDKYAQQFGIKPEQLSTLISIENAGGRDLTTSKSGAAGMGQFTPTTAKQYGVNVNNPESGIAGAAHYYSDLLKQFNGNELLAAQAYNMGPNALKAALKSGAKLPQETMDYAEKWTRKMASIAQGEQTGGVTQGPNPIMDVIHNVMGVSTQQPNHPNPHQDNHGVIADGVGHALDAAGAALGAANKALKKNVYHPANEAWVNLESALQYGHDHPLQAFTNTLGALGRGGLQVNADVTSNLGKKGFDPMDPIGAWNEAQAVVKTAADYFNHPQHIGKVLQAITDPKQTQVLTDTIEKNVANHYSLPDPKTWPAAAKLVDDIVTQGGVDPLTYAPIGPALKVMGEGLQVVSHATLGMGILTAVKTAMPTKTLGPLLKAGKTTIRNAAPDMIDHLGNLTTQMGIWAQKSGQFIKDHVASVRHDLDGFFTPHGKLVRMGIENAADHVKDTLDKNVSDLLDSYADHEAMEASPLTGKIPTEIQHQRLANAYRFGDKTASAKAEKMGKMLGWTPSEDDKMNAAQGLVDYGKNLWPRILSYAVPKEGMPQSAKEGIEFFRQHKGITDVDSLYAGSRDELEAAGDTTMGELLKHSFAVEHEAIRNGFVHKQTAKMIQDHPDLIHPQVHEQIENGMLNHLLGVKAGPLGSAMSTAETWGQGTAERFANAMNIANDPAKFAEEYQKHAMNYVGENISHRPPTGIAGKGPNTQNVLNMLNSASNVWKTALAGTGLFAHAIRNVGDIAFMVGGSPMTAAKGFGYALKGVPEALKSRMENGGSWSTFWHETPEIMKSLTARAGIGAVTGGLGGNAATPDGASMGQRIGNIAGGAVAGAGVSAALPALTGIMDRVENGLRAAHLESMTKLLNPISAADEFALHAKVSQDLGGYIHMSSLVNFLKGIGGTFVAYRLGTVPRAFVSTMMNRTGRIVNAERAQQDVAGQLPSNKGQNPQVAHTELHALGPMDEGAEMFSPAIDKVASSPATIGMIPGAVIQHFEQAAYDKTHPKPLSESVKEGAYGAAGLVYGGGAVQSLEPGLNPYKDQTGLPFWGQEIMHIFSAYATKESNYTRKLKIRNAAKAKSQ